MDSPLGTSGFYHTEPKKAMSRFSWEKTYPHQLHTSSPGLFQLRHLGHPHSGSHRLGGATHLPHAPHLTQRYLQPGRSVLPGACSEKGLIDPLTRPAAGPRAPPLGCSARRRFLFHLRLGSLSPARDSAGPPASSLGASAGVGH